MGISTTVKPATNATLAQSGTQYLFDSTADSGAVPGNTVGTNTQVRRLAYSEVERAALSLFVDRAGTVFYQELAPGSTTWRTINGSGSGVAIAANTHTSFDYKITSGSDFRFYYTEGGADVLSVMEASLRLTSDRSPGV